jgi:ParB family transcriptional regulator, chromosome partitioning protein
MLKPKGLGRGLASLIPNKNQTKPQNGGDYSFIKESANEEVDLKEARMAIVMADPDNIELNPHQPRKTFNDEELNNLVESIREHGILQPLVVIKAASGHFQLVAGERRLRASRILGLKEVPVIVRAAEELESLELSLIENIQRQDLNPLEEAEAYYKLNTEFSLTQEEIAKRVGKKRSTIANIVRLLQLPLVIKKALAENRITLGHAKVILEATDEATQIKIFNKIIEGQLSVKESEREVKKIQVHAHQRLLSQKEARILEWEERLRERFGQKVTINKRGSRGGVLIEFYAEEELIEIIRKLLNK